jgi:soluble lytic murein transglycosylase-like protein
MVLIEALLFMGLIYKTMLKPFDLQELIRDTALRYDIREDVLAAIVWQESRGNPFAIRFEPKFHHERIAPRSIANLSGYVPKGIPTLETEKVLRSTSFGLCQVMGETARWFGGLKNQYLTVLIDPALNIDLGARYLRHLMDRAGGPEIGAYSRYMAALKAYNGGSDYPDIIFDHVKKKSYLAMYKQ